MLSSNGAGRHSADLDYHLQAANKAFYANRWLLCDRKVSLHARLQLFASLITPVACFAAGHRTLHASDARKLDVEFRKLMRQVVGPPGGLDWTQPWHAILHLWHERVQHVLIEAGVRTWSTECLSAYFFLLPTSWPYLRTGGCGEFCGGSHTDNDSKADLQIVGKANLSNIADGVV